MIQNDLTLPHKSNEDRFPAVDKILDLIESTNRLMVCTNPSLDFVDPVMSCNKTTESRRLVKQYNAARQYQADLFEQPYNIGTMSSKCRFCNAYRFVGETDSICCSAGKVSIQHDHDQNPLTIKRLLTGNHPRSKQFLQHIRQYNSAFSDDKFWLQRR